MIKVFKKVVKTSITKKAFKSLEEANIEVVIDTRNAAKGVNQLRGNVYKNLKGTREEALIYKYLDKIL